MVTNENQESITNNQKELKMLNSVSVPQQATTLKHDDTRILTDAGMHSFSFKGHKVCYWKKGSGAPMIFFHNGGNDHRIWGYQVEYFSKFYEVYVIDNLGYGLSDKPEIDYTLSLYSDMVECFIEETGLEDVIISGHCIGAAMSLYYALRTPQKVKALILFNLATIEGVKKGVYGIYYRLTRYRLIRKTCLPFIKRLVLPRWKVAGEIAQQYGDTGEPDDDFKEHLYNLYTHPKQLHILTLLINNFDSFAPLDKFTKPDDFPPVCLIWGNQNKILPVETGKELCKRLSPEHAEFVENCGHLVMREKADEINLLMDTFLKNDKRL